MAADIGANCCVHKSHCRLEALRTLNLAQNSLESVELLVPMGHERKDTDMVERLIGSSTTKPKKDEEERQQKQFDWRDSGQQVRFGILGT